MASDWTEHLLEDCVSAIIDYRGKTPAKTSSGIPLITAKVVKDGRIERPDEFIAEADYEPWMRRGMPEPGDVVLTTEAPLGEVAQLGIDRVALAQRLITLRGKQGLLDNTFLKYLMQSRNVQDQLRARASGTTVFGIRQSELRKVILTLPPFAEQQAIGNILGSLDEKIELNRQSADTTEAIFKTLFKAWFVEFDPVRAKVEGRRLRFSPELLDPFPESFDKAESGEIPSGWSVGQFGDVTENPRRGISPHEIEPATPYIALEHMPRKSIALSEWGSAVGVESGKFAFHKGEILFGKLRPYFHKVGVAPVDGVCSTDILVIRGRSDEWFGFVLGHVSSTKFVEHTNAGSTGTKMPRTNWTEMAKYPLVLPPESLAKAFNDYGLMGVRYIPQWKGPIGLGQ